MPLAERVRETNDRNAPRYDRHAVLEQEVGRRLLDRVTFRRAEPDVVLDLGCGTAADTAALKKSFRKAQVIGLDLSRAMLGLAGRRSRLGRPIRLVNGDMAMLPFARHSADLVYSNLALPWLDNRERFFNEVLRILKPGGMFLFSTYGPGTFAELDAELPPPGAAPEPRFPDLLELGDALAAAGFREPVMDIDTVTLTYPGLDALAAELEATGSSLLIEAWGDVSENIGGLASGWASRDGGERYPLTFEILYGMAFGPPEGQPRRTEGGEIAMFSVDSLLKSRNLGYDGNGQ